MYGFVEKIEDWWVAGWERIVKALGYSPDNYYTMYWISVYVFRVLFYGSIGIIFFSLIGVKQKVDKLFKWARY